jgi:tetratricopeptide (TPR) repeat protein
VAKTAGLYQMQVRSPNKDDVPGRYRIELAELRPATSRDKELVNAELALMEGVQLMGRRDYQRVIKKYEDAAALFRAAENTTWEGFTLSYLGSVYLTLGEREKALDCFQRTLQRFRETTNQARESWVLNTLGEFYYMSREPQQALQYFNQALALFRQVSDTRGEAEALHNTAYVYLSLNEVQQAINRFESALEIREKAGDESGKASTLTSLGIAYNNSGNSDEAKQKALDCHNRALEIFRRRKSREQASALNNIGRVYASQSQLQKALDYYNQALQFSQQAGDNTVTVSCLINIGATYDDSLDNKEEALKYYRQALPICRKIGDRGREAVTIARIAKIERARGQLNEARARIDEAIGIIESFRPKIGDPDLRASYFAGAQDYYEFSADLLMELDRTEPSGNYKAEALQISERARARGLLDLLTEARVDIRAGVASALLEQGRNLELQLRLRSAAPRKEIEELRIQLQEVQAQIRAASPQYTALAQPQPLTLAGIQQLLDADTLLLEYALGGKRSYLWAVTQNDLAGYELPRRAELEGAAERVYGLLTARSQRINGETLNQRRARLAKADKEYWAQAAALSQMLLGPAAAQLGRKRLLIVAAGQHLQ